jgi:hypothetical protein
VAEIRDSARFHTDTFVPQSSKPTRTNTNPDNDDEVATCHLLLCYGRWRARFHSSLCPLSISPTGNQNFPCCQTHHGGFLNTRSPSPAPSRFPSAIRCRHSLQCSRSTQSLSAFADPSLQEHVQNFAEPSQDDMSEESLFHAITEDLRSLSPPTIPNTCQSYPQETFQTKRPSVLSASNPSASVSGSRARNCT